jgi:hypothetical protein
LISNKDSEKGSHLVIMDEQFFHGEAGDSWMHPYSEMAVLRGLNRPDSFSCVENFPSKWQPS